MQRNYTKEMICSIQDCNQRMHGKNYCIKHYNNLVRNEQRRQARRGMTIMVEKSNVDNVDRNRMLKRMGMKDIENEKLVEEIAYLKEKNSEQSVIIAILKDLLTKELTR